MVRGGEGFGRPCAYLGGVSPPVIAEAGAVKGEIARGAKHWLAPGAAVVTADWAAERPSIRTGVGPTGGPHGVQMGEHDAAKSVRPAVRVSPPVIRFPRFEGE